MLWLGLFMMIAGALPLLVVGGVAWLTGETSETAVGPGFFLWCMGCPGLIVAAAGVMHGVCESITRRPEPDASGEVGR